MTGLFFEVGAGMLFCKECQKYIPKIQMEKHIQEYHFGDKK